MHEKPPGADRLQTFQRMRHPVDIGYPFPLQCEAECVFTEDVLDTRFDLIRLERVDRDLEYFAILINFRR
jgi:hypothetical protein